VAGKRMTASAMEQAAQWFVVLASGEASAADRERWRAWREAHPDHEQAWQRVQGSTARFAAIPQGHAAASLRALADPLPGLSAATAPRSRSRRKGLAQLVILLAVAAGGMHAYRLSDWSADFVTAAGEQRDTTLADGSRLLLDTGSAVDVAFSADSRVLRLRRGRILVATAPDPAPGARPFMVQTADGSVQALGTRFTVQQQPDSTLVTVLEARVALHAGATAATTATAGFAALTPAAAAAPILSAGQAARFNRHGLIERHAAPPAGAAWVFGMLVADKMPLGELVAELARYRAAPLACDPAVAGLRISGAFPLRDIERALAAVGGTLPVRVERSVRSGGESALLVRRK
jgi:transmembrane sensor